MPIVAEPYSDQAGVWPQEGRHILAQFDDDTIIVYQAYRPSIGRFRGPEWGLRRRLRLHPDELGEAQFPLDDAPIGLGYEGRPGGRAGPAGPSGVLRRAALGGRPLVVGPRPILHIGGMVGGGCPVVGEVAVGPGPRPVGGPSWGVGPSSWAYEARRSRHSGGASWSRSSTCPSSWRINAPAWRPAAWPRWPPLGSGFIGPPTRPSRRACALRDECGSFPGGVQPRESRSTQFTDC